MPKRKARKSLFSSDAARRVVARVEHETEDDRYERLRTARERMAISGSQDTEERRYFRLRDDASRHAARRSAETPRQRSARLHADHPSLTTLIAQ